MFAAFIVPFANPRESAVIVAAHVERDQVIIDIDLTDRPLRKALLQAGVSIGQIAHLNSAMLTVSSAHWYEGHKNLFLKGFKGFLETLFSNHAHCGDLV